MILDLRTIYLMDAALYMLLHAAIWVSLISYRSRTVAAWSLSGIVSSIGLVFLGMRGVWPDWTLVIIGQLLMAGGNLGRQLTLRSMLGPIPRPWLLWQLLFNAVYLGGGLIFYIQDGSDWTRLVLLFYGFYTLNLVEYLLIGRDMRKKMGLGGAWAIEFAGAAFCLSLGIKTVALLMGWGEFDLYTMAWDQAVVFIGQFVAISLINVGFLQAFVGQIQEGRQRAEKEVLLEQQRSQMLQEHAQATQTLLKEREEIIRQLTLSNKSAGMGDLVDGIAHEVNQPLTALVLKTEIVDTLLQNFSGLEQASQLGEEMRKDALKVSQIVRTLRSMFMTRSQHFDPINFPGLVRDLLLIVEGRRQRAGVQMSTSLPELAMVSGDVTQLQQVVLNLFNNALDALSEARVLNPVIDVQCECRGGYMELRIADNGPGIDLERQDDVFALFKTSKAQGMGVGLWLSRSIVNAHGGHLGFEASPLDHGAVFVLRLPLLR